MNSYTGTPFTSETGAACLVALVINGTTETVTKIVNGYKWNAFTPFTGDKVLALTIISRIAYEALRYAGTYIPGVRNYLQSHTDPAQKYTKQEIGAHTFVAILASAVTAAGAIKLHDLLLRNIIASTIALTVVIAGSFFFKNDEIERTNQQLIDLMQSVLPWGKDFNQREIDIHLPDDEEKFTVLFKELKSVATYKNSQSIALVGKIDSSDQTRHFPTQQIITLYQKHVRDIQKIADAIDLREKTLDRYKSSDLTITHPSTQQAVPLSECIEIAKKFKKQYDDETTGNPRTLLWVV